MSERNFIDENLETWTDEECLLQFGKFLGRVKLATTLVQDDEGAVVGKQITCLCGEMGIQSEVRDLDWPLMRVPGSSTEAVIN